MDKYTVIVQLAELVAQARREGFEALLLIGHERGWRASPDNSSFLSISVSGYPPEAKTSSLAGGWALYVEAIAELEKLRAEKVERLEKEKAERRDQYLKLKAEFYGEGV